MSATIGDAYEGPSGVNDHFTAPDATSRAISAPFPAPPAWTDDKVPDDERGRRDTKIRRLRFEIRLEVLPPQQSAIRRLPGRENSTDAKREEPAGVEGGRGFRSLAMGRCRRIHLIGRIVGLAPYDFARRQLERRHRFLLADSGEEIHPARDGERR